MNAIRGANVWVTVRREVDLPAAKTCPCTACNGAPQSHEEKSMISLFGSYKHSLKNIPRPAGTHSI